MSVVPGWKTGIIPGQGAVLAAQEGEVLFPAWMLQVVLKC